MIKDGVMRPRKIVLLLSLRSHSGKTSTLGKKLVGPFEHKKHTVSS